MPSRRQLLGYVGATTVSVSGCLGTPVPGSESENGFEDDQLEIPDSPEEYPVNEPGDRSFSEIDTAEMYKEIELGSQDGVDDAYDPHRILVWNGAGVDEAGFGVIDAIENEIIHHDSYAISEGEQLTAALLEPSKYVLKVYVPERGEEHVLQVPCDLFDCNRSSTRIGIFPDGGINSSVISTLIGCPGYSC